MTYSRSRLSVEVQGSVESILPIGFSVQSDGFRNAPLVGEHGREDVLDRAWENGYIDSYNDKLCDELLNVEIIDTLLEAKVLTERWRQEYKTARLHSSLG